MNGMWRDSNEWDVRDGDSRDVVGHGAEGLACTSLGWSSGFRRRGAGATSPLRGLEETSSQRQGWVGRSVPVTGSSGLISASLVKSPATLGSACSQARFWHLWTQLVSSLASVGAGAGSSRGTGRCWLCVPAVVQNTSPESSAGAGGAVNSPTARKCGVWF